MNRKNYYQTTGRPHSGLADPAKYGLTYEQVVELIEKGKWNSFRSNWNEKRRRRIARKKKIKEGTYYRRKKPSVRNPRKIRKKLKCFGCKKRFPPEDKHVSINEIVKLCETCVLKIKEIK